MVPRPKPSRILLAEADLKLMREAAESLASHSIDGLPIPRAKYFALRLLFIARRAEPNQTDAAHKRNAAALAYQIRRELNPDKPTKTIRYEVSQLSGFSENNIEVIVARERNAINRFLALVKKQAPDEAARRKILQDCLDDNDRVFT